MSYTSNYVWKLARRPSAALGPVSFGDSRARWRTAYIVKVALHLYFLPANPRFAYKVKVLIVSKR